MSPRLVRRALAAARARVISRASLAPIALVIVLLLLEGASVVGIFSPFVVPAPSRVGARLLEILTAEWFAPHVWVTTVETLAGFAIGSSAGILIAALMVGVPMLRSVLTPYVVVLQLTPTIVLAPIFVTWLGFGLESKIAVAAVPAFFVVVLNTLLGLTSAHPNSILLMRSLAASPRQVFVMLRLRAALPHIFAGMKAAVTLALIGAVVGEFLSGQAGLGLLVQAYSFELKPDLSFAVVLVISGLGLVLFGAMAYVESRIVFWRGRRKSLV